MFKPRNALMLLGLATVLAAPALVRAEDKAGKEGEGRKPGAWMEKMKKELDLTDAQVDKIKEANKTQQEINKPMRDQAELDMAQLKVLVDKKAGESELKAALDKLKQDREALRVAGEKHKEAMAKILTVTQQAKMVAMMGDRMEKGGRFGMRGRGHGGKGGPEKDGGDKGQAGPPPEGEGGEGK